MKKVFFHQKKKKKKEQQQKAQTTNKTAKQIEKKPSHINLPLKKNYTEGIITTCPLKRVLYVGASLFHFNLQEVLKADFGSVTIPSFPEKFPF